VQRPAVCGESAEEIRGPDFTRPETQPAPAAIAWESYSKLRADLAARESSPVGAPSASRRDVYREMAGGTLVLRPLPERYLHAMPLRGLFQFETIRKLPVRRLEGRYP
jgi:hypothetical protein